MKVIGRKRKRKFNESVRPDTNTDDDTSESEEEDEPVYEEEISRWKKQSLFQVDLLGSTIQILFYNNIFRIVLF